MKLHNFGYMGFTKQGDSDLFHRQKFLLIPIICYS